MVKIALFGYVFATDDPPNIVAPSGRGVHFVAAPNDPQNEPGPSRRSHPAGAAANTTTTGRAAKRPRVEGVPLSGM